MTFTEPEHVAEQHYDVVILGGGIAGLSLALSFPPALRVALLTKGVLGESNTRYAQGGLAAAVSSDDSPELHLHDTLVAGAGLCDEAAVRILVEQAPTAVRWLIELGAEFDRKPASAQQHPASEATTGAATASGQYYGTPDTSASATSGLFQAYIMGHEAAHSRRRVLHAHGDATGAEIERALVAAVRGHASITIFEQTFAADLLTNNGQCVGVLALDQSGQSFALRARATVLANGGAGRLWLRTSNPPVATADGLALAWRAGAALADLEFTQFHPTVLVTPDESGSAFLISEAVRGEGAYLRNTAGERFMPRYHPDAELAPRDVVARAILSEMLREGAPSAYLDLRHLPAEAMYARFPTIATICKQHGFDLAHDLIPVAPAAHYFMGGVAVDTWGRTTVPNLYAIGEVACTGVHGANRLASNSLLEGLVYGRRVAAALTAALTENEQRSRRLAETTMWPTPATLFPGKGSSAQVIATGTNAAPGPIADAHIQSALQRVMWEHVSLYRDETGLQQAADAILRLLEEARATKKEETGSAPFVGYETSNMLQVAQLIITAALQRHESRGSHYRHDYPATDPALNGRHTLLLNALINGGPSSIVLAQATPQEVICHV
jgi:L-aspartate oxidase